jgi:hypothetical protein
MQKAACSPRRRLIVYYRGDTMEINVMDENEVRHMYMQGFTVKQIGEIMYKQAQKRLKEEITAYVEWTIANFKYWEEDNE